jgi:hypothetical protein
MAGDKTTKVTRIKVFRAWKKSLQYLSIVQLLKEEFDTVWVMWTLRKNGRNTTLLI